MKPKEKEIIKHLRKGKRVNVSSIAREIGLPASTVNDAIKRIEKKYVLKRSSLLDYSKLGYNVNKFLAVKVKEKQKFLDFLRDTKCVNSVFMVNGGFDFLVEVVCGDAMELINWVDDVKSEFNIEIISFQVLKTEEKERFVPW